MKRISMLLIVLVAIAAFVLPGCSGVWLNDSYSKLLDDTASLSAETAQRANDGQLSSGDMRDALMYQAYVWKQFQNGRDGVKGDPQPNITSAPTTQPSSPISLLELAPPPPAPDSLHALTNDERMDRQRVRAKTEAVVCAGPQ